MKKQFAQSLAVVGIPEPRYLPLVDILIDGPSHKMGKIERPERPARGRFVRLMP